MFDHRLTTDVCSYRPSTFWRIFDGRDTNDITYIGGLAFGTHNGAWATFMLCGAFWRWRWYCPECRRRCDVLYVVSVRSPMCKRCAGLAYPTQYEKAGNDLLTGYTRPMRHAEQRRATRRARWRRYYARHRARILQRRHKKQATQAEA